MMENGVLTSDIPAARLRDTYALIGRAKIAAVVDDFYGRVRHHPTLAGPFGIVTDWDEHKARLTHFWWLSLGGPAYRQDRYRVAEKHMPVGVTHALIDDWLKLFQETLNDHLPEEVAALWFARASNMGDSLRLMSDYYG
jgi:hemoglobin